jgi:5'-methylthioadenosine phosphorylase
MTYSIGIITSRITEHLLSDGRAHDVPTPFGAARVVLGTVDEARVACIERYGPELTVPSHKINYRANLWALRSLGVRAVLSQNAIGSCNRMLRPGDIVIPDDLLDLTYGRVSSFFDELDAWVRVDATDVFCPRVRSDLVAAARTVTERWFPVGTFACVQGPRLETSAEIESLRRQGADIVGTPVATEAILAKEAQMCFASLAPVINFAAGLAPEVNHAQMNDFYYSSGLHEQVEDILARTVAGLDSAAECGCHHALADAYFGEKPDWLPEWRMAGASR